MVRTHLPKPWQHEKLTSEDLQPFSPRPPKRFRPTLNRAISRYFVYRHHDAAGQVLYIGRSHDPVSRLAQHACANEPWVELVAGVQTWGPYTWPEACMVERQMIYDELPPYNREFVLRHPKGATWPLENELRANELIDLGGQ